MGMNLGGCIVRTFRELLKYHFTLYLKTSRFIMPLIVWLAFMLASYSIRPQYVVPSFLVSMTCLFFIMIWISFSYLESIDNVSEQLMILKVKNQYVYYLSKDFFLMLIGVVMSIIGVIFPVIMNALNGFKLFNRPVTARDIVSAFLIYIVFSSLGCSISILLQPRCIKSRKIAIGIIALIALISVIKIGLVKQLPEVKYIMWIFPPVSEIQSFLSNKEVFYLKDIVKALAYGTAYVCILDVINIEMLKRKLF